MAFTSNAVRRLDANGLLCGRHKAPAGGQFVPLRALPFPASQKNWAENISYDNQCRRPIQ
jgi:hypothetical protein